MRTLSLNKRPVWQVEYMGERELKDDYGLYTGEIEKIYSEPSQIRLNLYTGNSEIIQDIFGTINNIDIICSDETIELKKGTKLFYTKPTEDTNLETEFDLEVTAISESLNHWNYGFRRVD